MSAGSVPDDFGQLVSQFETFLANLKSTSDTISKSSETFEKKFRSVGDHIDTQQQVRERRCALLFTCSVCKCKCKIVRALLFLFLTISLCSSLASNSC